MDNKTIATTDVIQVNLDGGGTLNLRPYTTKAHNTAWGVLRRKGDGFAVKPTIYGVNVSSKVIGARLPKHVLVLGVKVPCKPYTSQSGRKGVKANDMVVVNGKGKSFTLRISQGPESFNVSANIGGLASAAVADET